MSRMDAYQTLTDADHHGTIEPDRALLDSIAAGQAKSQAAELERQLRAKQVPAVDRRKNRGGRS